MITKKDLDEAIMECNGKRDPDANTCIKLAAFYTIREHLFPVEPQARELPEDADRGYSYDPAPPITYEGDSEFAEAVRGRPQEEVFPVLDELMETLKVINPRLYAGAMRRLR